MEFLRSIWFLCFMAFSLVLGEDFSLPTIVIEPQKIHNFFSSDEQQIFLEIILNKKAKINGKWYKKGDYFLKYQISQIKNNLVVLKNSNDILTLYITPKKSNLLKAEPYKSKENRISFDMNKNPIIKEKQ